MLQIAQLQQTMAVMGTSMSEAKEGSISNDTGTANEALIQLQQKMQTDLLSLS